MLRIGICDDTAGARDSLRLLCLKHFRLEEPDFFEFSGGEGAVRWLHSHPGTIDLLFLDIEMAGMDGMTAAKQIRGFDQEVMLCFVTGYADYIAQGYEVSALHYLTKPVDPDKLSQVLTRAVGRLRRNEPTLTLELPGEVVRVPLSKIRYVDVLHNYVTVHADRDYNLKRSLGELEQELGGQFYRIGRSCVVNLNFVSRVTRTSVELSGGGSLPLPRGQYEGLNRAIIERI